MKIKSGFTLSELLIALAVLGLVAVMAINSMQTTMERTVSLSGLQQANALLLGSYERTTDRNGPPSSWGLETSDDKTLLDSIKDDFSYTKKCENAQECYGKDMTMGYLNGGVDIDYAKTPKLLLSKNIILSTTVLSSDCTYDVGSSEALKNVCGVIGVDVNGLRGPNQFGKDYFEYFLTTKGFIPTGTFEYKDSEYSSSNCSLKSTGRGCTSYVLTYKNLDYLKNK